MNACDILHTLEVDGVCQGVRVRSHTFPTKARNRLQSMVDHSKIFYAIAQDTCESTEGELPLYEKNVFSNVLNGPSISII